MNLRLKLITLALAAAVFGLANPSKADTIQFSANGTDPAILVNTFDFFPGNAIAIDGNPTGGLTVGSTFELRFQAILGALLNAASVDVTPAGLNTAYQITAVARLTETVLSAVTIPGVGGSATFVPAGTGVNTIELWFHPAPATFANNLTGANFNTGTLILSGTITGGLSTFAADFTNVEALDQFGADNYPGQLSVRGAGGVNLDAVVNFADPAFFRDLAAGSTVSFGNIRSDIGAPFEQVDPSGNFFGHVPNLGPVNGAFNPLPPSRDFQFEADANATFALTVIPEPSTVALSVVGFVGLALAYRARARRQVA